MPIPQVEWVRNIISRDADESADLPECPRYLSGEIGMDGTPHPASYKWLKAIAPYDHMRVCSLCGFPVRVATKDAPDAPHGKV